MIWQKTAVCMAVILASLAATAFPVSAQTFDTYRCADGTSFIVGFYPRDKRAHVQIDGQPVTLKLRPAKKDEDAATVELRAGVNAIVVEVAQMDGDWGFYFRLEDDKGGKLRLGPKGELVPL